MHTLFASGSTISPDSVLPPCNGREANGPAHLTDEGSKSGLVKVIVGAPEKGHFVSLQSDRHSAAPL